MPSITTWTRIEPRTVVDDPLHGLQARLADPLWLLARQWQIGAFRGEDGGSPVSASVRVRSAPLSRFLPRAIAPNERVTGGVYDRRRPLEAAIAAEASPPDLRMRARAGQRLLDALQRAGRDRRARYLAAAPLDVPGDLAPLAGRVPDGLRLLEVVEAELASESDDTTRTVLTEWVAWCRARFGDGAASWASDRLEYVVSTEAAGGPALVASLADAELDWYTFDAQPGASLAATEPATERTTTAVPTPVQYDGMPATRFWQIEEDRVFFGGVDIEPEDLARMLFVELALVGADDWFVLPVPVATGAVHAVVSLEVRDTFGRVTPISPMESGSDPRWSMFCTTQRDAAPLPILVLPPSTATMIGEPIEDVAFVRDEAANLAWAIERAIESPLGRAIDQRTADGSPSEPARETPTYHLRTNIPAHWTPMVPIEVSPGVIELRRGRLAGEDVSRPVASRVLAEATVLREEVLLRAGVNVTRAWVYARASDGTVHTWRARAVSPRTTVAASGLAYDVLV